MTSEIIETYLKNKWFGIEREKDFKNIVNYLVEDSSKLEGNLEETLDKMLGKVGIFRLRVVIETGDSLAGNIIEREYIDSLINQRENLKEAKRRHDEYLKNQEIEKVEKIKNSIKPKKKQYSLSIRSVVKNYITNKWFLDRESSNYITNYLSKEVLKLDKVYGKILAINGRDFLTKEENVKFLENKLEEMIRASKGIYSLCLMIDKRESLADYINKTIKTPPKSF